MKFKKRNVKILVFNCGSSSLKYKIIQMPQEKTLVEGEAERVGVKTSASAVIHYSCLGKNKSIKANLKDHLEAFYKIIELLNKDNGGSRQVPFELIAHRFVHPGRVFSTDVRITKLVFKKLQNTFSLAPIHNLISYSLIKECGKIFSHIPQYAVFDTSFHNTIPRKLASYALPRSLVRKYRIKRFGFHGISHQYVMQEACVFMGVRPKTQRIISCHLGTGGASICAIDCGKSINNSMGFTPLEGLVMNTRSGNVDIGLVLSLMFNNRLSPGQAEDILNKKSGVIGMYRESSDIRDIIAKNQPAANKVMDIYIERIRKYLGYYILLLKKVDIIIFTDSIGVSSAEIRQQICLGFEWTRIKISSKKNYAYLSGIEDLSAPDSQSHILVIPNNEELMIARQAYKKCRCKNEINSRS
jgi:acetate kinase